MHGSLQLDTDVSGPRNPQPDVDERLLPRLADRRGV